MKYVLILLLSMLAIVPSKCTKDEPVYIGTIIASDPDEGQTLTYTIKSGNSNGIFVLDGTSGKLYLKDIKYKPTTQTQFVVEVTDNDINPLSSDAVITVIPK